MLNNVNVDHRKSASFVLPTYNLFSRKYQTIPWVAKITLES